MLFRKAVRDDAGTVSALYEAVKGTRFCVWNESYPGEEEINSDLAAGCLYVLEDAKEVIGAISIVPENETDGFLCWQVRQNAWEFARVVIRPDRQAQGLSRLLIDGVLKELRAMNAAAVHISVAKGNIPAQKLYAKAGFVIRGEAEIFGGSYYLCELILGPEGGKS
ncbi:MAG: GNAT family N-acetyltransferase [Clostridiales bacterium]|nr:GNAT family N-acetyltransferase [Clostridiales bacterium]